MPRTAPPRPPARPPGSAEEGAARIHVAAVKLFDRDDGHGADWRLMAESLFKAAFMMLDGLPEDDRRKIARRVHEGSYNRMTPGPVDGDSGASKTGSPESVPAPSNTASFKSPIPKPPR